MSSDPQYADAQQQEQMRQYVEQLRAADPSEIVAQAFTMLGTGAEVKIGRPDARVLIDAASGLVAAVEDHMPQQLRDGLRNGLAQLQQAQVQAEGQAEGGAAGAEGGAEAGSAAPGAGAGDAGQGGQPGAGAGGAGQGGQPGAQPGGGQRMTDRLWVPGRDQPPPAS